MSDPASKNQIQTPTKGRIVLFTWKGSKGNDEIPAIVTRVSNDDVIDLQAFGSMGGVFQNISYHDLEGTDLPTGHSWRWPPRA